LKPRGSHAFSAVDLRDVLAGLEPGVAVEPSRLIDYRAYYSLEFPDTPHQHSMYCVEADAERIAVQHYLPPAASSHVFVCHGYYDHVGLYGHVIDYFLSRGIGVVAYDQIGHGLSTGALANIEDFDRYVVATDVVYNTARARLTTDSLTRWHWFGQSMGGSVVLEYLQQQPPTEDVGEVVLLAPLVRPYAWWINRWVFAIAKRTIEQRPRVLADNAQNPEFHALQKIDPLQARVLPVAWIQAMVNWYKRFERYPPSTLAPIVLQGDDDKTVDRRYNLKVLERRYPEACYLIVADGRHHLANESDEIRQQMWSFLDDKCNW
jgi:alpha-beta hydrolase superfamily lysophospholipase